MTISLRLNNSDSEIIKAYAEMKGLSISEFVRRAVLERIEDEFDLKAYESALSEYKKNPVTYSLDEVIKEINDT